MHKEILEDFSLLCDLRSSRSSLFNSEMLRLIKYSVLQGKYEICLDEGGAPRGYIAWADVNVEAILKMKKSGRFPRYSYEWNEGDVRLVIDVLMHTKQGDLKLSSLMFELVKNCNKVAFVKRGTLRMYVKKNGRFVAQPIEANMPVDFLGISV